MNQVGARFSVEANQRLINYFCEQFLTEVVKMNFCSQINDPFVAGRSHSIGDYPVG